MTKPLISIIAGARPNFMKVAPIIRELSNRRDRFDWELVHTGQHYDRDMSDVFFEELEIPKPNYYLDAGGGSHAEQTAKIMVRYEEVCLKSHPRLVLVVGDVNSTLACSIVAKKLQIEVAHVEAGLRSGDMHMPEEINRMVTDSITDYFFVTEPSGMDNLRKEGKPEASLFFVGHVMIDNLFHQLEKLKKSDLTQFGTQSLKASLGQYGIVTLHRPSNVDSPESLANILGVLGEISARLPLIFAVHPRTAQNMQKFGIEIPSTIHRTPPLPYMEFLNLWSESSVIFTDSGGIQEESTALGIPCVTLRENTERPVTVTEGTNVLVGSDKERIREETLAILGGKRRGQRRRPALWDGKAAIRIVDELQRLLG
ncbi:MAG: UDP-N-acetylglucosamine 2-epimerase (non-hydrolyzing) [Gammaproteobacteria bacterium]|nr:UDP-N-acetylglucosamine 2-epimerase (non-hydrolyzing) [Gammaproteobacteria bacterium]